jgi:hypothetical protein
MGCGDAVYLASLLLQCDVAGDFDLREHLVGAEFGWCCISMNACSMWVASHVCCMLFRLLHLLLMLMLEGCTLRMAPHYLC